MQILPIHTRKIKPGDDLAAVMSGEWSVTSGDIVVISSKAVAMSEGRIIDLRAVSPTPEAQKYAEKCGRSPEFIEAVLEETKKRNGSVVGTCPGALLTELKPNGLSEGTILTANAGLDESNAQEGTAIGWPEDPVESVRRLRKELEEQTKVVSGQWAVGSAIAIVLSDSCCRPRRWGVTAYALTVAGLDPLLDQAGREDLFGKKLRITKEAVADQLATAANFLMGNAGQSIPAVIIRDHGLALSDYEGWVPGVGREEDLFRGLL